MLTKKQPITIIASKESYTNLVTFEDITQLNDAVRYYKDTHTSDLTKNAIRVLNLLHRYSAKYKGVSFMTKNNIAKQLEISRRTVIRACQLLESLEIIKQYEAKRKSDMQQTSNIIAIQPVKSDGNNSNDTQEVTQADNKNDEYCHSKKTTASIKQLNINTRKQGEDDFVGYIRQLDKQFSTNMENIKLDSSHVSSNIPSKFINSIKPFFDSADVIYSIYKRLCIATKQAPDSIKTNMDDYISTFKQTLHKLKTGRIKGDYLGYLCGAFKRTCDDILSTYIIPDDSVYFDWLNE